MAYKKVVSSAAVKIELDGAGFIWNIRNRVGYGYQNEKNDVRLVQFLLNRAIIFWNDNCDSGDEVKTLETDGIFGGQTWNRIKWFQSETKDSTKMADGMVSPVDGSRLLSPKTKQIYTMYTLNKMYHKLHPTFFADPTLDPKCPEVLKTHFRHTASLAAFGLSPYGGHFVGGVSVAMGDGSVRW